ncbi:BglG family transcription antiterminator [Anaerorhabdus furcosa]|uniref:Transcriptional antiterminator n=1 Tax=Anaerorhabdus furcosa TaxID=118967 RepID=A0A1T4MG23_9FIRM|nr:PTS sugar transporter subunit IIA [Anaerorhabdus furcosa]SJZ65815.1 Transcriptional antiterminator [Anaerorhabdus furcosa]
MNIRTKKIIISILDNPEITITQLAYEFNVSERSIRNDIQELNNFLCEKKMKEIIIHQNKDISFDYSDLKSCLHLINESGFYDYKLSRDERIYIIIEMLLKADDYLTISEMAERLYISVSTVNMDLKVLSEFAKKHDVSYTSEQYKGIKLEGDEYSKRMLLLDMICSDTSVFSIGLSRTFNESLKDKGIDRVNQVMSYFESNCKIMMTDSSYKRINAYLYIMMHRIREGYLIRDIASKIDEQYKINANKLCQLIDQEFALNLPVEEINGVANILSNLKYLKTNKVSNDIIRIQFYVNRLIEELKKSLHLDLSNDYLFFIRLCLHVEYMTRKKIQHVIDEKILKEVCNENKHIAQAIDGSMYILEELLNRPIKEIEKEYIVLHVCAAIERKKIKESGIKVVLVSDVGIASSQLLLEKIKNNFDFSIIDILPVHASDNFELEGVDMILSTVKSRESKIEIPWIKINLNFSDDDYSKITQAVNSIKSQRLLNEKGIKEENLVSEITEILREYNLKEEREIVERVKSVVKKQISSKDTSENSEITEKKKLSELLPIEMIEFGKDASTWKESISKSAEILLNKGYIEKRYIDAMINKIESNGPYMVLAKGFAVPHAGVDDGGKKTGFSLIKLNHSVDYNSPLGEVQFVCCLSVTDMASHLRAFFSLVNLLQNKEFYQKMMECQTPKCLHKLIEEYE